MLATWGTSTGRNPTLDLQFAGATSLDNRITFSRGTTATYFNSAGVLTTAGTSDARFDYNPSTLAAQGLLIEEQRTNSIRNNTMQGAVAGTPGTDPTNWVNSIPAGITQQIVGTGTESGITYIDYKFSGTATGSIVVRPDGETQVVASSGQAWTGSIYVRLIAGTLTNVACDLNMRQGLAAGGLVLNTSFGFTPTSAALNTQRIVNAVASMQPTTERIINRVILNTNGAIDITLRIGLPQLEQGAFATSVIPTTTTALTRNADVASMTGTNFSSWYNASEGTLFAEASRQTSGAVSGVLAGFAQTATFNQSMYMSNDVGTGNSLAINVINGGVSQAGVGGLVSPAITSNFKAALAYATNNFAGSINGGTPVTDTSGTVPTPIGAFAIGNAPWGTGSTLWSGYIRRLSYYPVRLPNSTLQALTA